MVNLLVVGSGGREYALCWKLSQSGHVENIFVWPGSDSIDLINKSTSVRIAKKDIMKWCKKQCISLVIIGPEAPLEDGLADKFRENDILCFGPSRLAAKIETSKYWSKEFMDRYDIPTAKWKAFNNPIDAKNFIENGVDDNMLVIKASCLAAGKGVIVANNARHACEAVDELFEKFLKDSHGEMIIVEELLVGEEVSILGFSDGNTVKVMLPVQDHKTLLDNDQGPNTGGMGAYCPCDLLLSKFDLEFIERNIMQKVIDGLKFENTPFVGVLYAGLMVTKDGPKVLEYNCRFGDPETEVLMPLLTSDLYEIVRACCNGSLSDYNIEWDSNKYAVGVIMASKGYPESSSKCQIITGIDNFDLSSSSSSSSFDIRVFHCATSLNENKNFTTNGGRVLCVVGLDEKLLNAAIKATNACDQIQFEGSQFRRDIASKGIIRSIINSGSMTYRKSGVDIEKADNFVSVIKNLVKTTSNIGVLGNIGQFGALYDIKPYECKDPVLVSGTDGVGSKLRIAQICKNYQTIGIDLVAMCVNDIIAQGAEPLFFLDYYACGKLNVENSSAVVVGIIMGCKEANCALIGGETAEMPGLYNNDGFDLAGFATGIVERGQILPKYGGYALDDVVIGLPSNGLHSNGFSLLRKVIEKASIDYNDVAPFSENGASFGHEFLRPTKIYVSGVLQLMKSGCIKAFAHITGGGLLGNIPRILPKHQQMLLNASSWNIPLIFGWLATIGEISSHEMLKTFNCGLGAVLIISKSDQCKVLESLKCYNATVIGSIRQGNGDDMRVEVRNFDKQLSNIMKKFIPDLKRVIGVQKRVAVLISGTGTNLSALINATRDPIFNIGAEIVLVISSKRSVNGLSIAKAAGINTEVICTQSYGNRPLFDQAIQDKLIEWKIDFVCLAGFMLMLGQEFVHYWRHKLINIHPSLLPSFKGLDAQKQALSAGVKITGCTVHYVDHDMDTGAIIIQKAVDVMPDDNVETLTERIKIAEHECYPKALKILIKGDGV